MASRVFKGGTSDLCIDVGGSGLNRHEENSKGALPASSEIGSDVRVLCNQAARFTRNDTAANEKEGATAKISQFVTTRVSFGAIGNGLVSKGVSDDSRELAMRNDAGFPFEDVGVVAARASLESAARVLHGSFMHDSDESKGLGSFAGVKTAATRVSESSAGASREDGAVHDDVAAASRVSKEGAVNEVSIKNAVHDVNELFHDATILRLVTDVLHKDDEVSVNKLLVHLKETRERQLRSEKTKCYPFSSSSPARSWADQVDDEKDKEVEDSLVLFKGSSGAELEHGEFVPSPSSTKHGALSIDKDDVNKDNEAVKGNWASVVKQGAGGMSLRFIKPSPSEGKMKIRPPPSVVRKGAARWEHTVVGFFLDKLPFSLVQNHAMKIWNSMGLLEVLSMGNGFFFFRFSDNDSARHVLEGGPWYFGGRPIFLQPWKVGLNLSKAGCQRVPIWVHFYNIPLEYWSEEGLSYIASVVGKPLHADHMTESLKRIHFARICVEIGVDEVLPDCFDIEMLDGSCVEIRVEYNWVPKRCVVCKEFGHLAKNCKKIKSSQRRPKAAPSWAPSCPQSLVQSDLEKASKSAVHVDGKQEEG